ncbi:hypothetical protein CMI37_26895 [Candidatus Pacearchaeota archaeon]|nr:hypothetical protein [Candidatus Pacearchaeota archaeon]|tara:strand:- start:2047 stop:2358 length:312 start_codon:yes stop_codon:yes gene_type:complete
MVEKREVLLVGFVVLVLIGSVFVVSFPGFFRSVFNQMTGKVIAEENVVMHYSFQDNRLQVLQIPFYLSVLDLFNFSVLTRIFSIFASFSFMSFFMHLYGRDSL